MKPGIWLGQATTGAGVATLLTALSSWASGSLTWQQAVPLVIGGLAGIIWPENPKLTAATEKAAGDLSAVFAAYRATESSNPTDHPATIAPTEKK